MPDTNDAIYEIVATDAWRSLITALQNHRKYFIKDAVQEATRTDAELHKITRAAGRVQAVDIILDDFKKYGEKRG